MPRTSLEKLINASDLNSLGSPNELKLWNSLESTTNQPLAKINLYYNYAWWTNEYTPNESVTYGPNFTDLPLGSVYPFYSDDKEVTKSAAKLQLLRVKMAAKDYVPNPADQKELLKLNKELKEKMKQLYKKPAALTIYCDYQNINFWQGFAKVLNGNNAHKQDENALQITELNPEEPLNSESEPICENFITPASNEMVHTITEYFKQLFQTNKVPAPIVTSVRIWEGSQSLKTDAFGNFGYGVHQWGVGAVDDKVIEHMVKPFGPNIEIYTCGEAYSDFQGWVEGALRSTNLVLKKGFDIDTNVDALKVLNDLREKYNASFQ